MESFDYQPHNGGPLIVDDSLLRWYVQENDGSKAFRPVEDHLADCDLCQSRLLHVQASMAAQNEILFVLLEASVNSLSSTVHREDGGFYCCPIGLAASGFANPLYPYEIRRLLKALPIFPEAAQTALRVLAKPEVSYPDLDSIANSDPAIAASIVNFANSAALPGRRTVSTLGHATRYIGALETRNVILTALLRPWLGQPQYSRQWRHSLHVARSMELLSGKLKKSVPAGEAFLAGLVHDIGRLPFELAKHSRSLRTELHQKGWPSRFVERTIYGFDHAELGGDLLRQWNFPPQIFDAVKNHHSHEFAVSDMAALLYICEEMHHAREDTPSDTRLEDAFVRTGIDPEVAIQSSQDVDQWVHAAATA